MTPWWSTAESGTASNKIEPRILRSETAWLANYVDTEISFEVGIMHETAIGEGGVCPGA